MKRPRKEFKRVGRAEVEIDNSPGGVWAEISWGGAYFAGIGLTRRLAVAVCVKQARAYDKAWAEVRATRGW